MSLRKRIARVERALAERKKELDLADCRCGKVVGAIPGQAKELAAKLNDTCPVHGFLRVFRIMTIRFPGGRSESESEKEERERKEAELQQVIDQYETCLRDWMRQQSLRRKLSLEIQDGSTEV